jgi:hypothetical protein
MTSVIWTVDSNKLYSNNSNEMIVQSVAVVRVALVRTHMRITADYCYFGVGSKFVTQTIQSFLFICANEQKSLQLPCSTDDKYQRWFKRCRN